MGLYGLLAAALLVILYSAARKKLRRQTRELDRLTTRFDEFAAETSRLLRRSDRAVEQAQRGESPLRDRPEDLGY